MKSSSFSEHEQGYLKKVGANVKMLRIKQGMTQESVADRCGLNKHYISDIEHGKRNPALLTLIKICEAMNVEINSIFD